LCNLPSKGLPLSQVAIKELKQNLYYYQDNENAKSAPTARLFQLTYNINRSKNSIPISDIADYLPFPHRAKIVKQLSELENVTRDAAIDYYRVIDSCHPKIRMLLKEWDDGLKYKATS
jgi:hypothetical protein